MEIFKNLLGVGIDIAQLVITKGTPIGACLHIVERVIESHTQGVSDLSVIKTIKTMAKSAWNNLDDDKVKRIIAIINE